MFGPVDTYVEDGFQNTRVVVDGVAITGLV
jgi:hypothetical protein